MSESECLTADWRLLGYEDAAEGRTAAAMLTRRREACAKHGVSPQLANYRQGYEEGLNTFCTAYNGFQKGSSGYRYQGICSDNNEADFLIGYRDGQHLYELHQVLKDIDYRINRGERRVDKLEKDIKALRAKVISDDSTPEQRARILDDIGSKEHEIGAIEAGIVVDLQARTLAERDYHEFRASVSY